VNSTILLGESSVSKKASAKLNFKSSNKNHFNRSVIIG